MSDRSVAIEPAIRDQAVHWYVAAQSGLMDASQRAELEHWLGADARHAVAWQRLTDVGGQLRGHFDAGFASTTLQRAGRQRRAVLKTLVGAGLLGAAGWQVQHSSTGRRALADYRTATGERRSITLADGTRLLLNTATAIDVDFTATQRLLTLHAGEIDIVTGRDARPLIVATTTARLRPIGTRFSVRCDTPGKATLLTVSEGRVAARTGRGDERIINAGQGTRIDGNRVAEPWALNAAVTAWTDGVIIASRMRLADFLDEVSRYRRGLLRCDPAVADLQLTGAYPIDDTDQILRALAQTLPVSVSYRTRWWVSVGPR